MPPGAALIGLAYAGVVSPVWVEIGDYEFKLVQTEVKKGDSAILAVRLVNKRSGKALPGAGIIAKRVDMAPDGMAEMTGPIEQLPSTEPGVYRFKAALVMAGGWRLSLAAKVQGETGTVENKLERPCHDVRRPHWPHPRCRPAAGVEAFGPRTAISRCRPRTQC